MPKFLAPSRLSPIWVKIGIRQFFDLANNVLLLVYHFYPRKVVKDPFRLFWGLEQKSAWIEWFHGSKHVWTSILVEIEATFFYAKIFGSPSILSDWGENSCKPVLRHGQQRVAIVFALRPAENSKMPLSWFLQAGAKNCLEQTVPKFEARADTNFERNRSNFFGTPNFLASNWLYPIGAKIGTGKFFDVVNNVVLLIFTTTSPKRPAQTNVAPFWILNVEINPRKIFQSNRVLFQWFSRGCWAENAVPFLGGFGENSRHQSIRTPPRATAACAAWGQKTGRWRAVCRRRKSLCSISAATCNVAEFVRFFFVHSVVYSPRVGWKIQRRKCGIFGRVGSIFGWVFLRRVFSGWFPIGVCIIQGFNVG